jgi:hypothetical protein
MFFNPIESVEISKLRMYRSSTQKVPFGPKIPSKKKNFSKERPPSHAVQGRNAGRNSPTRQSSALFAKAGDRGF